MSSPSECPNEQTLLDYIAGRLDPSQMRRLDDHLAGCGACSHAVAWFRSIPAAAYGSSDSGTTLAAASSTNPSGIPAPDAQSEFEEPLDDDLSDLFEASTNPDAKGRIHQYDVLEVVGHGGMGVVYKAFDTKLQRTVALKILKRHLAVSSTAKRRFEREARAAAAISHPNVVTIFAVEECQGVPYIAMEFVDGCSLRQRTRKKPFTETMEIIRLSAQIAAGLAAAHAKGVIHRDVKPANIMLENKVERAKITDFGLARVALEHSELTSHGLAVGTPAYMAPEQVLGETVDGRSDLFSLGCVMYAMVAGYSPFHGKVAPEVSRKIVEVTPTPLAKINASIPSFFTDVVERLLEKKPCERFQTAAEVEGLLGEYLAELKQNSESDLKLSSKTVLKRPRGRKAWSKRRVAKWAAGLALAVILLIWFVPHLIGPPVEPPDTITVSKTGKAHATTLSAAITRAGPRTTIRVLDDSTYEEHVAINDRETLKGVRIVSEMRATIKTPQSHSPVISVIDTPGVVIEGFRIVKGAKQFAIAIDGACEGVTIDNVRIENENQESTNWSSIVFKDGARGTETSPMIVRNSVILGGVAAIYVEGDATQPVEYLRIENNQFRAGRGHVQLQSSARNITLFANIFDITGNESDYVHGIVFNIDHPQVSTDIHVYNNTFFGALVWLDVRRSSAQCDSVEIRNNLILKCREICNVTDRLDDDTFKQMMSRWSFSHNVWQPGSYYDARRLAAVATLQEDVDLLSTDDPESDDYLRLPADSPLMNAGQGGEMPNYVGARPARDPTEAQ